MKRTAFAIIVCLASVQLFAQHISEQESLNRALQYLETNRILSGSVRMTAQVRDGGQTLKQADMEVDNVYAFNINGGGFIIASGDERAYPVLGYSDNGSVEWESMPENMCAWIKGYDEAIAALGNRKDIGNAVRTADPEKTVIEPLIKTHWNQDEPYWNQIPLYDGAEERLKGKNCYTGCVATALAQVMRYYEWPKTPTTGIPSYVLSSTYNNVQKDWVIDSIPPVTFDWDNMLDRYIGFDSVANTSVVLGTAVEQEAVSTLMRYCSQAVKMELSPNGSGASNQMAPSALYRYFGYAPSAYVALRINYDTDDWEDLIYNELAEGRPVPYSGFPDGGSGHAFVCDGYDGSGFYHFNWGWGGSLDGYFTLSALNPTSRDIGYSLQQEAVIEIKPTDDLSEPYPEFHASLNDLIEIYNRNTIYFYYSFTSPFHDEVTHDYAMGIIEPDGALTPLFIGDPTDSIVYDRNWMSVELDTNRIMPGSSYVLYPMVRFRNIEGSDWQMLSNTRHHVNVGRSPEGKYYIYMDEPQVDVISAAASPDQDDNVASAATVTVFNKSNDEYADVLNLRLVYYGDIKPDEIDEDSIYSDSEVWSAAAYLRAGCNTDVVFRNIELNCQGLVEFEVYLSDYTYIGSYMIDFNTGTPTGVGTVRPDALKDNWYDLNGRAVNGIPVSKGIYIIGNRKIIVR